MPLVTKQFALSTGTGTQEFETSPVPVETYPVNVDHFVFHIYLVGRFKLGAIRTWL